MSENRTLSGAVKRYLGKEHIHAHSAVDDVMMTSQIIKKQIEEYVTKGEMYESPEQMAIITSEMNKRVDLSGKFVYNENGAVVISFGKHKNKTILEVYHEDPSYFLWMSGKADFPTDTKLIAKQIYEKLQLVK